MTTRPSDIRMMQLDDQRFRATRWAPQGASKGLPLLFLNGLGANSELIAPFVARLAGREVITFDMPGIGGSPAPATPYLACFVTRMAVHALREYGHEKADVLGYSWGGAMAQQLAIQHPAMVNRMILAATGATIPAIPGDVSAFMGMIDPFRFVDPSFAMRALAGTGKRKSPPNFQGIGKFQPPSTMGLLYQMLAVTGWTSVPFLPFIRQQTLILMGGDDPIAAPVNGTMLKTLIPKAQMNVIKGGDHLFLLNRAEETVPMIERFLAG
jgi:pimeloyl-ACP methyl ester carboxylesterase